MSDIPHNRPARLSLIFSNIGNWEIPVNCPGHTKDWDLWRSACYSW